VFSTWKQKKKKQNKQKQKKQKQKKKKQKKKKQEKKTLKKKKHRSCSPCTSSTAMFYSVEGHPG